MIRSLVSLRHDSWHPHWPSCRFLSKGTSCFPHPWIEAKVSSISCKVGWTFQWPSSYLSSKSCWCYSLSYIKPSLLGPFTENLHFYGMEIIIDHQGQNCACISHYDLRIVFLMLPLLPWQEILDGHLTNLSYFNGTSCRILHLCPASRTPRLEITCFKYTIEKWN